MVKKSRIGQVDLEPIADDILPLIPIMAGTRPIRPGISSRTEDMEPSINPDTLPPSAQRSRTGLNEHLAPVHRILNPLSEYNVYRDIYGLELLNNEENRIIGGSYDIAAIRKMKR